MEVQAYLARMRPGYFTNEWVIIHSSAFKGLRIHGGAYLSKQCKMDGVIQSKSGN
jgi:hypothetical protein